MICVSGPPMTPGEKKRLHDDLSLAHAAELTARQKYINDVWEEAERADADRRGVTEALVRLEARLGRQATDFGRVSTDGARPSKGNATVERGVERQVSAASPGLRNSALAKQGSEGSSCDALVASASVRAPSAEPSSDGSAMQLQKMQELQDNLVHHFDQRMESLNGMVTGQLPGQLVQHFDKRMASLNGTVKGQQREEVDKLHETLKIQAEAIKQLQGQLKMALMAPAGAFLGAVPDAEPTAEELAEAEANREEAEAQQEAEREAAEMEELRKQLERDGYIDAQRNSKGDWDD